MESLRYIIYQLIIMFIICYLNNKIQMYSKDMSLYKIYNLKMCQCRMTRMLYILDKICSKYDIQYWCLGGTLIGVLRHKGWVPWDGDVDLGIFEEDYAKLSKVIQNELPNDLWFQDKIVDKRYKSHLGKIRDTRSSYTDYNDDPWHNGLQVDFFKFTKSKGIAYSIDNQYKLDTILPIKKGKFEGFDISIPNKPHEYISQSYKDYMSMPPRDKRLPHEGNMVYNYVCPQMKRKYPELYNK